MASQTTGLTAVRFLWTVPQIRRTIPYPTPAFFSVHTPRFLNTSVALCWEPTPCPSGQRKPRPCPLTFM
nr:MAG TPA: hypothetical protein [Herelleviridae sp.]